MGEKKFFYGLDCNRAKKEIIIAESFDVLIEEGNNFHLFIKPLLTSITNFNNEIIAKIAFFGFKYSITRYTTV